MPQAKHILVISYSQTGQLNELVQNFLVPLTGNDGIVLEQVVLQPEQPYAFPWQFIPFFNTFPETVHLQPAPISAVNLTREKYEIGRAHV